MKERLPLLIVGLLLALALLYGCPKPPPEDISGAVITMERTMCFGTCPAYSLEIHGDGTVIYEGEMFVRTVGIREKTIEIEKVRELVNEFYRIDYFSLWDRYEQPITDLPSTTTSITIDGMVKSVYNYFGAPQALIALEDKIDEIAGSAEWVEFDPTCYEYLESEGMCEMLCTGVVFNQFGQECERVTDSGCSCNSPFASIEECQSVCMA